MLRKTFNNPEDRCNVNKLMYELGHRDFDRFPQQADPDAYTNCKPWDSWLDRYEPPMAKVIENRFGTERPPRNADIPTFKLREYYETQMAVEESVCPIVPSIHPITIESRFLKG